MNHVFTYAEITPPPSSSTPSSPGPQVLAFKPRSQPLGFKLSPMSEIPALIAKSQRQGSNLSHVVHLNPLDHKMLPMIPHASLSIGQWRCSSHYPIPSHPQWGFPTYTNQETSGTADLSNNAFTTIILM